MTTPVRSLQVVPRLPQPSLWRRALAIPGVPRALKCLALPAGVGLAVILMARAFALVAGVEWDAGAALGSFWAAVVMGAGTSLAMVIGTTEGL